MGKMDVRNFMNQEKYNLFVTSEQGAWESDSYIMNRERCLTSFTSLKDKEEYGKFDVISLEKIKKYPCIFAYEEMLGCNAHVGYITDIIVRDKRIKFKYDIFPELMLPLDILHKKSFELDIDMDKSITELMHTHWTVKHVNLFEELGDMFGIANKEKKPVVFISYAWSPDENRKRVLDLAERLEKDRVDVRYDRKCLLPGQDINAFMEKLASDQEIKKILVICNSVYANKADARKGGVGTESEIIIPQVYANPMQNKIIPIFFEKDQNGSPFLPTYLKSRFGIDFTTSYEEHYKELLEDIFR